MNWLKTIRVELIALVTIIVFFALFFWPATLAGHFFVGGDAIFYSYPMRTVAWDMIRHGQLPLWTPTLLSGYPLLAMSQLALGYPLTWGYLLLSGHAAEQVYVLAPFLLSPIFTYFYARQIDRSRLASLLAGLTFGYGGLMASQIATYGILTNAVMWLPLVLTVLERARSKPFRSGLLWMTLVYSMSVLTGLGQGFLYVGIVVVAYAALMTFAVPPSGGIARWPEFRLKTGLQTFKPLIVCLCGMALAACLSAFQILETMQAQRQSIRSKLTYEMFSGGAFTFASAWQSFFAPFYHFLEEETFIASLPALLALVAIIALVKRGNREVRLLFWLVAAAVYFVLMLGNNSPVYRLLYHVPVLNLFRFPARHAFEWTFALAILAAFGWDRIAELLRYRARQQAVGVTMQPLADARGTMPVGLLIGVILFIVSAVIGWQWWLATGKPPVANSTVSHTGLSEPDWLLWKLAFTIAVAACAAWCLRLAVGKWRTMLLAATIAVACFVEPYILLQRWWFSFAKPASYFTQVSAPTKFLQQYKPEESRIYTSVAPNYVFDMPRTEPHNISARYGFHNAAGYEPLMSARYSKAFGNGLNFLTPGFSAPPDRQVLSPNWQVLDLLNVRFMVEFSAPASGFIAKGDARFATAETSIELKPGARTTLTGVSAMDTLTLVSLMANSSTMKDGEVVAQINFTTADGRAISKELQAGRDSSEWAHERPDVKTSIRHRLANIFDSRQGEGFPVHRYWARFDLGEKLNIDRVEIINIARDASLIISNVSAYDSANEETHQLAQRLPEQWRKVYDFDNVQIYENQRVLPRAWIVPKAKAVSEEEALLAIRGESEAPFNPREEALLEPAERLSLKLDYPHGKFVGETETKVISYESNRLTIETNANKSGILVVSEIATPGWEATIDGQPTAIYSANYLLRGVIVPEGKHSIEMRYTAPSAMFGSAISALTLLLIGGLAIRSMRLRRRQPLE
ncbi:MAG: YfhO family protein [Acidobacteria bacterium]|nr:YfhO family protein [Acidobacteriota bacterium]